MSSEQNKILLEILDEVQLRALKWGFNRIAVLTTATPIHKPHGGQKKKILLKASPKNTNYVYISPLQNVATSGAREGYPLEPNEVIVLADYADCEDNLYAIADATGQVVFAMEFMTQKKFGAKQVTALGRKSRP